VVVVVVVGELIMSIYWFFVVVVIGKKFFSVVPYSIYYGFLGHLILDTHNGNIAVGCFQGIRHVAKLTRYGSVFIYTT